jgi:hypothetical protein
MDTKQPIRNAQTQTQQECVISVIYMTLSIKAIHAFLTDILYANKEIVEEGNKKLPN